MHLPRSLTIAIALAAGVAATLPALGAQAGTARGAYVQTNLVSDIPGLAAHFDPNLKNPWGLSAGPTPIWVSDNNAGVATIYDGSGNTVRPPVVIPMPDGTPGGAPTGTVFNGSADFNRDLFLFATEDGTIVGWKRSDGNLARIEKDRSTATDSAGDVGAVYKGLASGSVGSANYLYATNFRFATVDVFDTNFNLVTLAGTFSDPGIPSGFAPFGIQNIGGQLFVTYAKQNDTKHDDVKGPGNGFVDVYSTSGVFVRRFATQGTLNSPWGLALSPSTFGNFHDDILVGDFGDGRINAFTTAGTFRGQLKSTTSAPIDISGLWGLRFGNGLFGASVNTLFFSAGINDEADGLFGTLQSAG